MNNEVTTIDEMYDQVITINEMNNQGNTINETNDQVNTNNDEMSRLLMIIHIGLLLEYLSTKCIINLLTSSKDLLQFRGKYA